MPITVRPGTVLTRAESADIDLAMSLDADSGGVWAAKGLLHIEQMEEEKAKTALKKAMELNPSHAMAALWYAGLMESDADKLI